MFVGHLAVSLLAKPVAPQTSLGTLVVASEMPDLLWVIFSIAGLEHFGISPGITATNALDLYDISLSHSLLMDAIWAAVFAVAYFLLHRYRTGAYVIFGAVLSHWILDFVSHRPDMPLVPGSRRYVGLDLYNSLPAMLVVEGGMWIAALIVYRRATRSKNPWGVYAFWPMIALLTLLWWSGTVGPPPPSVRAVEVANLIIFSCLLPWAYWIDRLRPIKLHFGGV